MSFPASVFSISKHVVSQMWLETVPGQLICYLPLCAYNGYPQNNKNWNPPKGSPCVVQYDHFLVYYDIYGHGSVTTLYALCLQHHSSAKLVTAVMYICIGLVCHWLYSNQSFFYRQIAGYQRSVDSHRVQADDERGSWASKLVIRP